VLTYFKTELTFHLKSLMKWREKLKEGRWLNKSHVKPVNSDDKSTMLPTWSEGALTLHRYSVLYLRLSAAKYGKYKLQFTNFTAMIAVVVDGESSIPSLETYHVIVKRGNCRKTFGIWCGYRFTSWNLHLEAALGKRNT